MEPAKGAMPAEAPRGRLARWWASRDFLQRRMIRMCLSILSMIVCFPLYYAGLFGGVEGPLSPARLGDFLAGQGVGRSHVAGFFAGLAVLALVWNYLAGLARYLRGTGFICQHRKAGGILCGAPARRRGGSFVCRQGHRSPEAGFAVVKKGRVSYTVAATALLCLAIVLTQ